ncbi:FAD-binding oxidoreductase [Blastomonas aquatica]|uniref:Oxidoreductase n=1 Tax=Blastomonas aquatica TaxID=1510276 RepID=A0ABQ1J122_9SPHN|nr:FAD-binding oxidoreductase [Blastomonas aquatica]GGB55399.1 oxidoreductase [Blastomonas aquatica]
MPYRAPLAGWGRYPVRECTVWQPITTQALHETLMPLPSVIARGNGRSYGDASMNVDATIDMRRLDRLITFDEATGVLVCEAGVLLSDLVASLVPRGWFPPVTPGTRMVTIGGMIASDVHGKNHHAAGSFCDHVDWFDLDLGDGRVMRCSPSENADLFAATCGGMGLTGIIVRVSFRMLKIETAFVRQRTIRVPDLDEALALFEQSHGSTYSVAWIDCMATGKSLGRSAILLGEHAKLTDLDPARLAAPLVRRSRKPKTIPIDFPNFALSGFNVRMFNHLYYAMQRPGDAVVDVDPYFYPLDAIFEWNRIYGRQGFLQYQSVLPLAESAKGMRRLLEAISAAGAGSFLAVLKRMGPGSFGMLSFPMEGYTLALDFPATSDNFALLERLDAITADHGGRVYLTKDARVSPERFAAGYPRLDEFRNLRAQYGLDRRFSSLLSQRLGL